MHQGGLPDLRHPCRPSAELADFELSLLDLLCQLDAADHYRCGSKLFKPSIGRSRCLIRRWSCSITLFRYLLLRTTHSPRQFARIL